MASHTRLSASGAERYIECPGSAALSYGSSREDSVFSIEGTTAHQMADECFRSENEPWMIIGERGDTGLEYTAEMARAVQVYTDDVRAMKAEFPHYEWFHEVNLNDPSFHPDFGGTADTIGVGPSTIIVDDYKHGVGIAVEVTNNAQLMYYAYGAIRWVRRTDPNWVPDYVIMKITQPRAEHEDGPIRVFRMAGMDLMRWANEVLHPAMVDAAAGNAVYKTGEHCRFCPAKLRCPVMLEQFATAAETDTASIPKMTDDELSRMNAMVPTVRMFIKALGDELMKRLLAGTDVEGYKLVSQRSDRVWNKDAEKELVAHFGLDAMTEPVLKSPAKIEELPGGKAFVARLAYKPETGVTVAPATDRRAAVKPKKADELYANVKG